MRQIACEVKSASSDLSGIVGFTDAPRELDMAALCAKCDQPRHDGVVYGILGGEDDRVSNLHVRTPVGPRATVRELSNDEQ
jgi:hypothetical protein